METVNLSYPLSENVVKRFAAPQVLALGQFDGLHLGHLSVIKAAASAAEEAGLPLAVMTFYPHPKEVMKKGDYDGYLTPPAEKERILRELGIDYFYVVEFNEEFSRISPEDFVSGMLLPLNIRTAVVGFDFHFGYKGAGDADMLRELGKAQFDVHTAPPFLIEGEKVSSSGIRKWLHEGRVDLAAGWFGRPYRLRGTVVNGEKRGRKIGFPTANVEPSEHFVLPTAGVYAVKARLEGNEEWLPGVMNIGVKPTFHEGVTKPSLEVHLFDFNSDIYGNVLTIQLISYIRPEQKFSSIDDLIAQIARDAETARKLLI
ncbi:bifunctional riboflavin kinase/FAD synthetase [Paenibacillus pinistramenti]|uniref:bifunctional riboflavin kinase/FAD synthetase n=1 Tax=Paenibacillus pinistramenti TaxID=1768003 RepID=UPI00110894F3|nr:bifunctional riboflavin kinase/FAD synthetase [Paenibacillus pinistramenti]